MNLSAHREFVRRHGLRAWPVLAVARAVSRLLRVRLYLAYVICLPVPLSNHHARFSRRSLDATGLSPLITDGTWDLTEEFVHEAFARGDCCIGAYDGEQLCGYAWYTEKETAVERGLTLTPMSGLTYSYKHFTHPSARGQAVQRCLAGAAVASRRSEGGAGLVTLIAVDNFASRRSVASVGAKVTGFVLFRGHPSRWLLTQQWFRGGAAFAVRRAVVPSRERS